jgi:predicted ATPase/class 3 adenylate cyclase
MVARDMGNDASSGTLTFVFTDLESSTRLWETFPDAMKHAMERHDAILRDAVVRFDGRVVKVTGDGVMAVFSSTADGVKACLEGQEALQDEAWGDTGVLRVRMGMHAGEAQYRAGDFYGPPVNRAARITAAAHGGQVLLSERAAELAQRELPAETGLRDLGEHRLKDLFQPEHIFQLVHPALTSEFPPLATLSHRPNNLPTQTSEFLGRETQLSAVRDLLDAPGVRLLTLTGPGGIGKTRLALQGAADRIDHFEDGVFFVDLSPVREADAAFDAIGRVVGLTGSSDEHVLDVLKRELHGRHMLLLLDNFEQVMDAADGVADLLQQCSQLNVLVTSREALRVRGEHLFPVPPMSLPDSAEPATTERVAGYEAVRLFVERAREAAPSFAVTDDNAAAVAAICARVDGLPLAIELAAARLKLFSPDDLRDRLVSRLEVLRGGPRDLPTRQRTLRSTIEWSYELLDSEERAMVGLLSLYSPARVESVEEVAVRVEPLREVDVVDRLASLVDKSLVRSVVDRDRPRLWMLETIREYAAERLQEQPELGLPARQAHAEYFASFAEERRNLLSGPERGATLDDLEFELGNLTTAWRYWVDARDLAQLHRLTDALWALYDARGWYHAAVELTDDLLGVLSAVPSTPELAREEITLRMSLARGLLAIRGYTHEVEEAYRRALDLTEETGEIPNRFPVLRSLASFYLYRGEFDRTAALGRELLNQAEQEGTESLQVEGHLVLGSSLAFLGDLPTGLDHLERAIALFDPVEQRPGRFRVGASAGVVCHTTSALLLWILGYPDRAAERSSMSVELAQQLSHPFTLAFTLFHTGLLDLWRRDFELAYERSTGVLDVAEEHDYQTWRALAHVFQGVALTGLNRPEEGLARMEEGVARYQVLKTPPVFWPLLLSVRAGAFGRAGRPADGLALIDQAIDLSGEDNIQYPEFALLKADLLLALGDDDGAAPLLQRVVDVGGTLGARMSQLRAATRLARLGEAAQRRRARTDLLRDIYETFTEGFEKPDLVDARAVLDEVDVRAM